MMKKMMGFTLAEVLTTLMVIGVVAAMTIPTLMNSTNDQQLKVAYKKAMSILSQGTQLMIAKEEECKVTTSAELAACFQEYVLSGSLVGYDNNSQTSGLKNNVVATPDGLAYAFYYYGPSDDDNKRSLEDICGSLNKLGSGKDAYQGKGALCVVNVDLNGFSKGAKTFKNITSEQNADSGKAGIASDLQEGNEQIPIILTGTGVRAVYSDAGAKWGEGYKWMFGDTTVKPYTD